MSVYNFIEAATKSITEGFNDNSNKFHIDFKNNILPRLITIKSHLKTIYGNQFIILMNNEINYSTKKYLPEIDLKWNCHL